MQTFFAKNSEQEKQDMNRLVELYANEVFEDFLEDPKCEECGDLATQRCSKCKMAWYCSRDCQLRQWKKHKPICGVFAEQKAKSSEEKSARQAASGQPGNKQQKKKPLIQEL